LALCRWLRAVVIIILIHCGKYCVCDSLPFAEFARGIAAETWFGIRLHLSAARAATLITCWKNKPRLNAPTRQLDYLESRSTFDGRLICHFANRLVFFPCWYSYIFRETNYSLNTLILNMIHFLVAIYLCGIE
jgi:hypothetical protein